MLGSVIGTIGASAIMFCIRNSKGSMPRLWARCSMTFSITAMPTMVPGARTMVVEAMLVKTVAVLISQDVAS